MGGPFPKKMLYKGSFTNHYFDSREPNTPFHLSNQNPIPKSSKMEESGIFSDFLQRNDAKGSQLPDLLDKLTNLDPEKRLTPNQALKHHFCTKSFPALERTDSSENDACGLV